MPRLKKRIHRDGYYVLTSIKSRMAAFQLTQEGQDRLLASGLRDGDYFSRGILKDLYSKGEAFTFGGGTDLPDDPRQLDLPNDPVPESIFPSCSKCASQNDLFLVTVPEDTTCDAVVLCTECRPKHATRIDVILPLPLATLPIFSRLQNMGRIKSPDSQVKLHKEKLDGNFEKSWEDLQKLRGMRQEILFPVDDGSQRRLID
jgi:hypothetical protein